MRVKSLGKLLAAGVALAVASGTTQAALAAPTRGYLITLVLPASYTANEKEECPDGKNPGGLELLQNILPGLGKTEAEIKKDADPDKFDLYVMSELLTFRARIDGKPVDAFLHPLASNEPPTKLMVSKYAIGFNLDGIVGPNDFIDPYTGEKGVDHEMARIQGCTELHRGKPETRSQGAYEEAHLKRGIPWLISLDGAENLQNAENVVVQIGPSLQAARVQGANGYQRNVTYTMDTSDPRMQKNIYRGQIKDGMFVSNEPVDFFIVAGAGYEDLKRSRLRIMFNEDGSVMAFLGGYQPIEMEYVRRSSRRGIGEQFDSSPAYYQAMSKQADTDIDKDPETGKRTRISVTRQLNGVPAYIRRPKSPTS